MSMELPIKKNPSISTTTTSAISPPLNSKTSGLRRRRRCLCCCLWGGLSILIVFLVLLTLALTLFKPKDPTLSLDSITVTGVAPSISFPSLQLSINVTLHLKISVHNPNFVSFSYRTGYTDIKYRGDRVGTAVVAAGNLSARRTSVLDMEVELHSGNFTANLGALAGDVSSGKMEFETSSRIPGKVKILGFIRKHVVAYYVCHSVIAVPQLTVAEQRCDHKTKL